LVDLSSDEEDIFPNTSQNEDFTRRLFDVLNRGLLGPPDDGKVIILRDFDEEEEVREENTTDTEVAPSSVVKSLAPTVSDADTDDASKGTPNDGRSPDREIGDSNCGRDEADLP
jgi:hypothetical protein